MIQFDPKLILALVVVAFGTLCFFQGFLRPRPASAEGSSQSATGVARGGYRKRAIGSIARDDALRLSLDLGDDVKEPTVLVAVEVLMQPDGAVAPGASRAVRRLSGLGGRVILCGGARSDVDEAAVRAALQAAGVLGDEAVALHRLVFYSTDVGRRAITRQLEPHVLMCPDAWVVDFEDVVSRVPCVVAVGPAAVPARRNRITPSRLVLHVPSLDGDFSTVASK